MAVPVVVVVQAAVAIPAGMVVLVVVAAVVIPVVVMVVLVVKADQAVMTDGKTQENSLCRSPMDKL
jgi:hypothetical protein